MGNCFTCFKSPPPMVQSTVVNSFHKEEMTEVRLYSAPSHVIPSALPASVTDQSHNNGNNKTTLTTAATTCAKVPEHCTSNTTITGGSSTTTASTNNTSSSSLSRFYQRRTVLTKPSGLGTMGNADCKPSDSRLTALFDLYKDSCEDVILAEGIEHLCNDLQLSPDEFRVLVLAWKLNAEQMCRFTRYEFVQGCKDMRVDSIRGIQNRLPEIVTEVERDPELFKDLYRFTFRFGLDVTAGQRILPTDMAVCLWRLVFSVRAPPILGRWLYFLELHPQVRAIPRDTWNMFLNFSESIGNDLSSYDDTEAWPSLFDDFVEYENDQMNQNVSKAKESDSLLIKNED